MSVVTAPCSHAERYLTSNEDVIYCTGCRTVIGSNATDLAAWLDDLADATRRRSFRAGYIPKDWEALHPDYQQVWRAIAMRDVPTLLLRRILAEYDEDRGRAPSFVTMRFIRAALAEALS